MPSMNKEIKEQWLTALRSGEYKQCRGQLVKKNSKGEKSFCCLGVLTDLAIKDNFVSDWNLIEVDYHQYAYVTDSSNDYTGLTKDVLEWAGIDGISRSGYLNVYGISLANKNDSGASFKQIADMIEKKITGV